MTKFLEQKYFKQFKIKSRITYSTAWNYKLNYYISILLYDYKNKGLKSVSYIFMIYIILFYSHSIYSSNNWKSYKKVFEDKQAIIIRCI